MRDRKWLALRRNAQVNVANTDSASGPCRRYIPGKADEDGLTERVHSHSRSCGPPSSSTRVRTRLREAPRHCRGHQCTSRTPVCSLAYPPEEGIVETRRRLSPECVLKCEREDSHACIAICEFQKACPPFTHNALEVGLFDAREPILAELGEFIVIYACNPGYIEFLGVKIDYDISRELKANMSTYLVEAHGVLRITEDSMPIFCEDLQLCVVRAQVDVESWNIVRRAVPPELRMTGDVVCVADHGCLAVL